MTSITVKLAHRPGILEVTPGLVEELRLVQQRGISFKQAWDTPPTFQEAGLNRSQSHCLWELARIDPNNNEQPDYETLLNLKCTCEIESGGVARVDFGGKELRFTPRNRWSIGWETKPRHRYFTQAVRAVRRLPPT